MMRLLAAWALILAWGLAPAGPASAADGLVHARDFKADAREAARLRVPFMVIFTSPGCHYCERVKREFLIPMHKDKAYRSKVMIREVTFGAATPLVDFEGKQTTEGAFAAAQKVFMVPP